MCGTGLLATPPRPSSAAGPGAPRACGPRPRPRPPPAPRARVTRHAATSPACWAEDLHLGLSRAVPLARGRCCSRCEASAARLAAPGDILGGLGRMPTRSTPLLAPPMPFGETEAALGPSGPRIPWCDVLESPRPYARKPTARPRLWGPRQVIELRLRECARPDALPAARTLHQSRPHGGRLTDVTRSARAPLDPRVALASARHAVTAHCPSGIFGTERSRRPHARHRETCTARD
jgi:hypothetical protein